MGSKIHIKKLSADRFTPLLIFKKLKGIALLESALLEMGKSRYSLILIEEAFRLVLTEKGIFKETKESSKLISQDKQLFLDIVRKQGQSFSSEKDFQIPIPAGGIGYLNYEVCRHFDEINMQEQNDIYGIPEGCFSFGSVFAVFDHYKDELNLVVVDQGQPNFDPEHKFQVITNRLQDTDYRSYQNDTKEYSYTADLEDGKPDFINEVKQIKQEIIKGNLLQGVPSRTIRVQTPLPPLEAYSRLRRENPSPYLFFLNFDNFQLFGSSPEVMTKLQNNTAVIKPLAGTRPRGKNLFEDTALEKELLSDPKELAEHLMLIDLARNDLGKVAKPGSVKPHQLFAVERYSHVMHIVSEIQAELKPPHNVCQLIAASFPAGTVSGAPKIKAIEIISGLEKNKRGPYAGTVGYFDINGNFDSCITIRSVLYKNNTYYISVGAGVVYDSDPEKEFIETQNKAKAMLRSLGVKI